jgi:hypothetical protein
MLSVLNVQSLLPVYPPKHLDSVLQIVLDHEQQNAANVTDLKDQLAKKCLFLYYFILDVQHFAQRTQSSPTRFKSVAVDFARAFGINLQYQRVLRGLWLLDSVSPVVPGLITPQNSATAMADEKQVPTAAREAAASEVSASARLADAIECFTECADVVRSEWGGKILRTLYLQSYFKETLLFIRTVQPVLSSHDDHTLVCLAWLWNGLYQQSLLYQRTVCAKNNKVHTSLSIRHSTHDFHAP